MAWWERDYDRPAYQSPAAPRWMPRRPPTASLVLVVIHVVAFAAMLVARLDSSGVPLTYARLGAPPNHWPSILLHPLTTWGISIIFVVYVVWVLGGKIERQLGPRRMVRLYVLGNLFAGAAYFLMAPVLGLRELHPLSMPAGAMAAWCLVAWREFRHEMVAVFGRLMVVGNLVGLIGATMAGATILFTGSASTAWLVAVIAGCLAVPASASLPIIRFAGSTKKPPHRGRDDVRVAPEPDDSAVDDILAKISRDGMHALTDEERARLEAARQAKLRR